VHLMGVHLMGVHLMGVVPHGVYLTGVHLMGVYLINVHLTGVHLMSAHLMGVHLMGVTLAWPCRFRWRWIVSILKRIRDQAPATARLVSLNKACRGAYNDIDSVNISGGLVVLQLS
jgi:hypothetical protein